VEVVIYDGLLFCFLHFVIGLILYLHFIKFALLEIIFKYSPLWILLIVALSLGFTLFLYYKNKREDFPKGITILLSFFRFIVMVLLGLYLLSPMLKTRITEVKKPIILMAVDNSQSCISDADSLYYKVDFKKDIDKLRKSISKKYRVDTYTFGEDLTKGYDLDFTQRSTNISKVIKKFNRLYRHKNVGALILATDGIYNQGQKPEYASSGMDYPIYTISMGDTSIRRDIVLSKVATNKLVFLGDRFPVEAKITAKKASGFSTLVSLFMDGKLVDERTLKFNSDFEQQLVRFSPKAQKVGIRKLKIAVKTIDNEYNKANNARTFFVEVANVKQKILIAYASPHPDIAAMVRSLKSSDNYEVTEKEFQEITQIKGYNLVIYHNLPSNRSDFIKMKNLIAKTSVPYLLIIGEQTNISLFNQMKAGIRILVKKYSAIETQPLFNSDFEMFSISKDFQELLVNLPPLATPFGKYSLSGNMDVILYQKIGNVKTEYPLMVVANNLGKTHAVLMGEGIWRWWLYDYQLNGNTKAMDEFLGKLVKMLSLKIRKEKFAIEYKNIFSVLEDVEFRAILHNAAFEPVTEPDVKMRITELKGKKTFDYTFSKEKSSYKLNVGRLEAGEYSFRIFTEFDKKTYSKTGRFVVEDVNTEQLNLEANHRILFQLSSLSGGELFAPKDMQEIKNRLGNRNDLVNVEYIYLKYNDLIDLSWVLFFIIVLMGAEWFLRKYYGSY